MVSERTSGASLIDNGELDNQNVTATSPEVLASAERRRDPTALPAEAEETLKWQPFYQRSYVARISERVWKALMKPDAELGESDESFHRCVHVAGNVCA